MRMLSFAVSFLVALSATPPHAQTPVGVDVELIIAVDVSRSMSQRELEIQRRGYAEALVSADVLQAISSGYHGQVALLYLEWAGSGSQRIVVDWTVLRDRDDARAIADRLTADFSTSLRRTSISGLLDFAAPLFDTNTFAGFRRVIDVSGDGPNNQGRPVEDARDDALARGLTINGLPLMTREGMGAQWHLDDLDEYYRQCVIGGPTAFVIPVLEWDHFPEAVRRKLVLELVSNDTPTALPAPEIRARPVAGYDCLVGEKIWRNLMDDWN